MVQYCTTEDGVQLHFKDSHCGNLRHDLVSTEPWYHGKSVTVHSKTKLQHVVSLGTVGFISHPCCSFGNFTTHTWTSVNFSAITKERQWVEARGRFLWFKDKSWSSHGCVINPHTFLFYELMLKKKSVEILVGHLVSNETPPPMCRSHVFNHEEQL